MLVLDEWLLTPERVALHVPTGTAVIADPHLGYHLTRQLAGDAIPLPSVAQQLAPLEGVRQRHTFTRLIVAGDLVERSAGVIDEFCAWLGAVGLELLAVVPGNHDRRLANLPCPLLPAYELAGWQIVHGDGDMPAGRMLCGHFHPSLWRQGGKRPCYLLRDEQLILPAFCPEAAGANVGKEQRWAKWRCLAILGKVVRDCGLAGTLGARRRGQSRSQGR